MGRAGDMSEHIPSEPRFHPVQVRTVVPEAESLCRVSLDICHTAVAGSYTRPGQYLELRMPGTSSSFFALASRPGDQESFELLIKSTEGLAHNVCALAAGEIVEITAAQGSGYSLTEHAGKNLLLVAMGSGIAPILSLLWTAARSRDRFGSITVLYGARTPRHFAGAHELAHFEQLGMRVVRVASQPAPGDSWDGPTGYVQDHLDHSLLDPGPVAVFACGSPPMLEGLRARLEELGHPTVELGTNY